MAKIGDFVISDGKITSVEREYLKDNYSGYYFTGNGFGRAFGSMSFEYTFNGKNQNDWRSRKDSRLATIADLEIFANAIKANSPDIHKPEVKEFIKRATEWILINDRNTK